MCVSFSNGFTSPERHACHVQLSSPSRRCVCPSSGRGDGRGVGAWQRGVGSGGVLRCARTPILSVGERYEKWDDCSYDDGGGGGSPDNRRELGGRVCGGGGGWGVLPE